MGEWHNGDIAERYTLDYCWCDSHWDEFSYTIISSSGSPILLQSPTQLRGLPERIPLAGASVRLTTPEIINITLHTGQKVAIRSEGIQALLSKIQRAIAESKQAQADSEDEHSSITEWSVFCPHNAQEEDETHVQISGQDEIIPEIQGCALVLWSYASSSDPEQNAAVRLKRTGSDGYEVLALRYKSHEAQTGWRGAVAGEEDPMWRELKSVFRWRKNRKILRTIHEQYFQKSEGKLMCVYRDFSKAGLAGSLPQEGSAAALKFQTLHHAGPDEDLVYSIVTAPALWERPGGNISLVVWHTSTGVTCKGLSPDDAKATERRWEEALVTMGNAAPLIMGQVVKDQKLYFLSDKEREELAAACGAKMENPCAPMEMPGLDAILKKVTSGFFDNLNLISDRSEKLDRNDDDAGRTRKEAEQLLHHAEKLSSLTWWENCKWKGILWALPVICLLALAETMYKALTLKDLRDDFKKMR